MSVQASKMWPAWIDELNSYLPKEKHIELQHGTHVVLNTKSGTLDDENYKSIEEALDLYKEPCEVDKEGKISGINPSESGRFIKSLYLPNEHSINTGHVLNALHYILTTCMGVAIIDDKVNIVKDFNKNSEIQTVLGNTYSSSQVVIASGAFSQTLINQFDDLKYKIPLILSGVGYSVLLKQDPNNPVKQVIRTPNRSGACGLHVLPRDKEILYVGASNNVFLSPSYAPTIGLLNFLFECAIEQINQDFYKSEIGGWHVGNRPAPLDTFPLIGKTSIPGVWLFTGTYRDGFHQSPFLAQELAKFILGEPHGLPDAFKPERPLIQTRTREESVSEFLHHYLSGAYEHNIKLPKFMKDQDFVYLMRPKIEYWYDKLDTDYNFSPDMLLMFNFSPNLEENLLFLRIILKIITA